MASPFPPRNTSRPAPAPLPVQAALEREGNEISQALRPWTNNVRSAVGLIDYFAALTLLAVWVARIIAPSLRGWKIGIALWIAWADAAASLLSQLLAVFGVLLVSRLLLRAFSVQSMGHLARFVLLPGGFAVVALVAVASQVTLDPVLSLSAATASGLVAAVVAPFAVATPRTRAAALVVCLVGIAALIQAIARRLALQASDDALAQLFATARYLATTASILMLVACIIGFAWLNRTTKQSFWIRTAFVVVALGILSWGAQAGSAPGASSWQVLLSRWLQTLGRHPAPLFVPGVHFLVLVAPLCVASLGFAMARGNGSRAAMILALIAGVHTDLAPMALALVAATAIVSLEAARDRAFLSSPGPITASSGPAQVPQPAIDGH